MNVLICELTDAEIIHMDIWAFLGLTSKLRLIDRVGLLRVEKDPCRGVTRFYAVTPEEELTRGQQQRQG